MEETNYVRKTVGVVEGSTTTSPAASPRISDEKKGAPETEDPEIGTAQIFPKKCYLQKLALKDKPKPNLMFYRSLLTMRFISWPVVFYAGYVILEI